MKLTLNLKNYQSYILTGLIIFGPIKSIFNGLILNVDLTLIILGIAFFDFLINIRKLSVKKHSFFFLLLLFGIWLLMLFSIPYSSSSIISYDKFFKFTIPIFCFIYPLVVERIEISVFYKSILYIVTPLSIMFILYKLWYWSPYNIRGGLTDVFYSFAGAYLSLGFLLSLGIIVAVNINKKLIAFFWITLMLALGARGPLFFTMIILLFLYKKRIIRFLLTQGRKIILTGFVLMTVVSLNFNFFKEKFFKFGLSRFLSFFNFDTDKSSQARIDMISYSIQEIFTNFKTFFIGNGVGSFGVDFLGKEVLEYPHIIFLEVWYELGILGFILIVTFLIAPLLFKRNIIYISFLLLILFDSIKSLNLLNMWITVIIYSIIISNIKLFYKNEVVL